MTPPDLVEELRTIRQRLNFVKEEVERTTSERTPPAALLRAALSVACDFLARADRILTAQDPGEAAAQDAAATQDAIFSAGTMWSPRESGQSVLERARRHPSP